MELDNIYDIAEDKPVNSRPLAHQTAPQDSKRLRGAVVVLGLLCCFLVVGLIGVRVHYFVTTRALAAELFLIKSNVQNQVQTGNDHIWSQMANLTEQRDRLNTSLVKATQELKKLGMESFSVNVNELKTFGAKTLTEKFTEKSTKNLKSLQSDITCPAEWKLFRCSCYLFSNLAAPWATGRDDCKTRGAHLIIINSEKEQEFIRGFHQDFWIGLSDNETEGTWKWVDGSPLTLSFWYPGQPNNNDNNPDWGAENCAHTYSSGEWNDLRCDRTLRWICEK